MDYLKVWHTIRSDVILAQSTSVLLLMPMTYVLRGPAASAMRKMLLICDDYANEFNILFNAKKSKFMYSPPYKCKTLASCMRPTLYVGGHSVEYVELQWSLLWHIISADRDDKHDIVNSRQHKQCFILFWCQPVVKQKLFKNCSKPTSL